MASKIHVKKDDTVVVLSGKDAGKKGKIVKAVPDSGRVYVAGLNMITKHKKGQGQLKPSALIKKEGSIDASNVMLVCPKCNAPSRVSHVISDKGTKSRVCKKCGAVIDTVKKASKEE
jgi:large subunit ribosomal protein L24